MTAAELSALLVAVGRQDAPAFEDLYRCCQRRVYGLARRVIRDEQISAETTQDVFLTLWQEGAARFDPAKGTAMAWIMTIAHRRAVDRVRSEQSRLLRDVAYGLSTHQPDSDVVADTVMQRAEAAEVIRCLSVLSPAQDQAIRLAYYTGMTYAGVAGHLGIPVSTAKTRIRDGLRKLGACLSDPPRVGHGACPCLPQVRNRRSRDEPPANRHDGCCYQKQ